MDMSKSAGLLAVEELIKAQETHVRLKRQFQEAQMDKDIKNRIKAGQLVQAKVNINILPMAWYGLSFWLLLGVTCVLSLTFPVLVRTNACTCTCVHVHSHVHNGMNYDTVVEIRIGHIQCT